MNAYSSFVPNCLSRKLAEGSSGEASLSVSYFNLQKQAVPTFHPSSLSQEPLVVDVVPYHEEGTEVSVTPPTCELVEMVANVKSLVVVPRVLIVDEPHMACKGKEKQ